MLPHLAGVRSVGVLLAVVAFQGVDSGYLQEDLPLIVVVEAQPPVAGRVHPIELISVHR